MSFWKRQFLLGSITFAAAAFIITNEGRRRIEVENTTKSLIFDKCQKTSDQVEVPKDYFYFDCKMGKSRVLHKDAFSIF